MLVVSRTMTPLKDQTDEKMLKSAEHVHRARPAAVLRRDGVEPGLVGLRVARHPGRRLDEERPDEREDGEDEHEDQRRPHGREDPPEALADVGRADGEPFPHVAGRLRRAAALGRGGGGGDGQLAHGRAPQSPKAGRSPDSLANEFGDHQEAHRDEHPARHEVHRALVAPEPAEAVAHGRRTERDEDEGDGEAGGVGDEEDRALGDGGAHHRQAQDPAEHRADAGRPAGGEDDPEEGRPAQAGRARRAGRTRRRRRSSGRPGGGPHGRRPRS